MATLNFPDNPDTGDTYSDGNSGFEYEWNGTVWISKDSSTRGNIQEIDDISPAFDGSTTDFILNVASNPIEPLSAQQLVISVGGVLQNAGDDYTVAGSTITFTTAPTDELTFFGTYLATSLSINTVADNTVSAGSLVAGSNYTVGGINVTGVSTLSGLSFSGISSIGRLEADNLSVSGVGTISNVIHTKDSSGLGATMGAAVGIVTYYGDAANLTGVGGSIFQYTYSPDLASSDIAITTDIVTTWNNLIQNGSGTITLRTGSVSGTVVDQFVVGSSSSITIAGNQLTLNPAVDLAYETQHWVVYPAGTIQALGGQLESAELVTTFTTKAANYQLWGWGRNNEGQLSQNNVTAAYSSPVKIPGTTWESIVNSAQAKAGLKTDGTLWVWGNNWEGTLGQNSRTYYSSPVQIPGTTWKSVGGDGNLAMFGTKTDGTLWSWGVKTEGRLGQNSVAHNISSPMQIGTDTTWDTAWSVGSMHGGATKTDGTLWVWGHNGEGALGQDNVTQRSSPTQIPGTWSTMWGTGYTLGGIKTDGTLWIWGDNGKGTIGNNASGPSADQSSPVQVGSGTDWADIGSAHYNVGAVKTDGTLWTWGSNTGGALGHNNAFPVAYSSPTQIPGTTWANARGFSNHTLMASKTDNTLWSWGYNQYGQLGHNNVTWRSSPTQIPGTGWDLSRMSRGATMNDSVLAPFTGT